MKITNPPALPKKKFRPYKSLFKPRTSHLDFETLMSEKHPMRGFFVLFWVSLTFKTIVDSYHYWKLAGIPISLSFANYMSKDAFDLLVADGLMILSLFTVVAYQWVLSLHLIPLFAARVIQHIWQVTWFFGIIVWAMAQDWAWVIFWII